jgi:hypothetical protein
MVDFLSEIFKVYADNSLAYFFAKWKRETEKRRKKDKKERSECDLHSLLLDREDQ